MTVDTRQSGSARENSVAVSAGRTFVATLGLWIAGSLLGRFLRRLRDSFRAAGRTSTLTRRGRTLAGWIRASYGYRWLTAEPDPEIIVIDLRETWTVGPLIRVLDWVLVRVERFGRGSRLYAGCLETAAAFRRAPIRVASLVVCAAVVTNTVFVGVVGSVGTVGLLLRGVLLLVGLAGTQIRVPMSVLADARTVRFLVAILEPPELADDTDLDSERKE